MPTAPASPTGESTDGLTGGSGRGSSRHTGSWRIPQRAAREKLDRSLAHGAVWTLALKAVGQTAAWVSTLLVARLLSPSDYGVFGMASLYLGLLQMLSEFGIGAAIVARPDVDADEARQLNTVAVAIGATGAVVLCATAPAVAWFFKTPALVPVLLVMSATFVIMSFRTVPWALLQRGLQFKRLALFDVVQSVVLAALSITLAAAGARYWTLVVAAVLSATLSAALTLYFHRIGFARPDLSRVRATLSLGGDVLVQRISWYGYSNADFLIAGRVLGQQAIGGYALAWTLANTAIDKIGVTILQVTPGVLARVRGDEAELRRYLLRITELMMLVLSPATVGLAIVAPVFVHAVLGHKWEAIITPLQILSVYATIRALMPLFSQLLLVRGLQRLATRVNLLLVILMPPVFLIGSRWGITGIALGWVLVYPVVAATLARRALQSVNLRTRTFLRVAVWPAMSGCIAMAGGLLAVRLLVPRTWPALVALPLEIVVGAAIYGAVLFTLHRDRVQALMSYARSMRAEAPATTPA